MNEFNRPRDDLYCTYCKKLCKNLNSLKQHELRCSKNINRNESAIHHFDNYRKIYGSWNKGLNKNIDKRVNAYSKKLSKSISNALKGKPLTELHKKHISNGMLKANLGNIRRHSYGKAGYYDNIWFASSYELAYYIYCKDHKINVIRNKQRFSYLYKNTLHKYTPDFYSLDDKIYIELKGYETEKDLLKYKSVPNLKVLYYNDICHMIEYVKQSYNVNEVYHLYIKNN
jgi:hypothetical protein